MDMVKLPSGSNDILVDLLIVSRHHATQILAGACFMMPQVRMVAGMLDVPSSWRMALAIKGADALHTFLAFHSLT